VGHGPKHQETNFWKLLKLVQAGPNTMGDITQQGTALTSELTGTNPQGAILVSATLMGGGGYQLQKTEEQGSNVEQVYWLPWKDYQATVATRGDYEGSKCNFFMTTALTGCRFTLTPTQVVHVANSAYEGPGTASQGRSNVEQNMTGARHERTRRLSISASHNPLDIQYNQHRTLVFGMKLHDGTWSYKIYRSHPAPGSWEIM
jgi:hypothetical protein